MYIVLYMASTRSSPEWQEKLSNLLHFRCNRKHSTMQCGRDMTSVRSILTNSDVSHYSRQLTLAYTHRKIYTIPLIG